MENHNGWELEYSGGGNYHLVKELKTKDGRTATVLISEMGASICLHDDGKTFKTLAEYKDDYTEDYIDLVDWISEVDGYVINHNAFVHFENILIDEIVQSCKHLDELYEGGF